MKKLLIFVLVFAVIISLSFALTVKEKWQNMLKQYNNTQNQYIQAKQSYIDTRNEWIAIREEYMANRTNESLHRAIGKAGALLNVSMNKVEKYLNVIGAKTENLSALNDEDKGWILSIVENDTAAIQALRLEVAEITNSTTKEEFVAVRDKVQAQWNITKVHAKQITGLMLSAKVTQLIKAGENISVSIKSRISVLQGAGYDTSALEAWLANYSSKLDSAKREYELAKNNYKSIQTFGDADEFFKDANSFIISAKNYVKSAYQDLVKIAKAMKQEKAGKPLIANQSAISAIANETE